MTKKIFIAMGLIVMIQLYSCQKELVNPSNSTFEGVIATGGVYEEFVPDETITTIQESQDSTIEGSQWLCSTVRVNLLEGNTEQPLFDPNASVIYPGNLLQGATLQNATPDIISVKRAGGVISYDIINGNPNPFFEVEEVSKSSIAKAMNSIIASSDNVLPSAFTFNSESVQSREQLAVALGLGIDSRFVDIESYMGFSTDKKYNRTLIKLSQKYYTMSFDIPTSLADLFAPEVTPKDLSAYVQSGNPATYISDVTYGRIFYMMIESTSTTQEMEANIQASFNSFVNETQADVDVSKLTQLKDLRVKAMAFGGDAKGTIKMLGETNLSTIVNRMAESSDIRTGAPLSYIVRNVANNKIVNVKIATEYDVTECHPVNTEVGPFDFRDAQHMNLSIATPAVTVIGDVDHANGPDIIYNHKIGSSNQIQVALNNGNGAFTLSTMVEHTAGITNWGDYTLFPADINGDGLTDLVWNALFSSSNNTYVALSKGDGTFTFLAPYILSASGWDEYRMVVADQNGDGRDDLAWATYGGHLRAYLSQGQMDGTLVSKGYTTREISTSYPYGLYAGKFNNDTKEDIMMYAVDGYYNIGTAYVSTSTGFTWMTSTKNFTATQMTTQYNVGDVNGDGLTDIVGYKANTSGAHNLGIRLRTASGFSSLNSTLKEGTLDGNAFLSLGDLDDNGTDDIVIAQPNTNLLSIWIVYGNTNNTLTPYSDIVGFAKEENWLSYSMHMADWNNDGKEDLLFVNTASQSTIYTAISK